MKPVMKQNYMSEDSTNLSNDDSSESRGKILSNTGKVNRQPQDLPLIEEFVPTPAVKKNAMMK